MGYRNYSVANGFVVDKLGNGDFTTIGAALTAATSGTTIFIRPGTYNENLTLKAGVSLISFSSESITPNVIINGSCTANFAGTTNIAGIGLQTNSNTLLTVSGSSATIVNLLQCNINCLNNTGISFTSSSASAQINLTLCTGNLATTGIAIFTSSSAGTLNFDYCTFSNTGGSTTASTASAGIVGFAYSTISSPITTSGTSGFVGDFTDFTTAAQNATSLTIGGSGSNRLGESLVVSGSAAAVSIGATLTITQTEINSTASNVITGAGTLNYTPIAFTGSGQGVSTTTRTPLNFGTWTPTITGGTTAGTTTYSTQEGVYTIVGNVVYVEGLISISAATGTGNAVVGALPFTVKNLANYSPRGTMATASATWTWPASTTSQQFEPQANTTNALVGCTGSGAAGNLQMNNSSAIFTFSCWYQI